MIHIRLKPTQRIKTNFNASEITEGIEIPQESKDFAEEYMTSNLLSDDYGMDLMLFMNREVIYGFDYLHNGKKIIIPEINPALIFYSNAIMSQKHINQYKQILLDNSPTVQNIQSQNLDSKLFGKFFQLAVNCIINLQASLENFINNSIPDNYEILSNNNNVIKKPNIHDKIDFGMVKLFEKNFENNHEQEYNLLKELISLRNDIIHLKPIKEDTNTKYKSLFRKVIDFDFEKGILAAKIYINFYSPNLIEECSCGKEYYYDIVYK